MKLEMDLIRGILLWCNDNLPENSIASSEIAISGFTKNQITFHIRLLADEGFIKVIDAGSNGDRFGCIPVHLTMRGYEFLESTKNDTIWNGMKEVAAKIGIKLIIDAIPIFLQILSKQAGLT